MEWYPRYPALWKADTMHLDPFQDGCYLRLVDHYMETRQPLPDNDAALARIIGISTDQWLKDASSIVRAFFKPAKDGKLHHKRCDLILSEQDQRGNFHSERAKKGAEARWKKANQNNDENASSIPISTASSNAKAMLDDATGQDRTIQNRSNPDGLDSIDQKPDLPPQGQDPDELFGEWWRHAPRKVSKGQARKAFRSALKRTDFQTLLAGVLRWAAEAEGQEQRFVKHPATWLNGECWLDETKPAENLNGNPNRNCMAINRSGSESREQRRSRIWEGVAGIYDRAEETDSPPSARETD